MNKKRGSRAFARQLGRPQRLARFRIHAVGMATARSKHLTVHHRRGAGRFTAGRFTGRLGAPQGFAGIAINAHYDILGLPHGGRHYLDDLVGRQLAEILFLDPRLERRVALEDRAYFLGDLNKFRIWHGGFAFLEATLHPTAQALSQLGIKIFLYPIIRPLVQLGTAQPRIQIHPGLLHLFHERLIGNIPEPKTTRGQLIDFALLRWHVQMPDDPHVDAVARDHEAAMPAIIVTGNFFALPKLFRAGFVKLCPQRGLVRHQTIAVRSAPLIPLRGIQHHRAGHQKNPCLFHERIGLAQPAPAFNRKTQLGMDKSTRCTSLRPWIRFYCSSSAWPPSSAAFSGSDCTPFSPSLSPPC